MSALEETVATDHPFETSLLEHGSQGVIGAALPRIDGPLKVSGQATYTAEYAIDNVAHGHLVLATVPRGTVAGLDDAAAHAVPGVIEVISVLTHPKLVRHTQEPGATDAYPAPGAQVLYAGQPIALVLAESPEAAREAALLLRARYDEQPGSVTFEGREDEADRPEDSGGAGVAWTEQGDIEQAMRDAEVSLDATYTTPSQNSAAMEPHATIAQWDAEGQKLTLHSALQMLSTDRKQLAKALDISPDNIRLIARYVGGGFGSKLYIGPDTVAAALGAQAIGRPVKVVMTRQQVMQCTLRRTNTQQRIRLGASRDGKLSAMGHDTVASNLPGLDFFESCGASTHFMYTAAHRHIHHDLLRLNWLAAGSMRAPGEGVGGLALESAMDEMAAKLGLDPIEFRKRNEPPVDPEKNIPFSSSQLVECMTLGAERFGWSKRQTEPAQTRDGDWWVGLGMAAAVRKCTLQKSSARVTLTPSATVVIETDMTDIGTGTYTILAQIAGELLGLPVDQVEVRLGDTAFPAASGSGGSMGAGAAGSSVYAACVAIRRQIAKRLGVNAETESDGDTEQLTFRDGRVTSGGTDHQLQEVVGEGLTATGTIQPGDDEETSNEAIATQASYGAHFAEVRVNGVTGEVRVSRMLGVFAAGRILNAATARSQCLGGMTFGIGAALHEALLHDPRTGQIMNHDLAEYHVPVNADVPQLEVVFVDERDISTNPLQSKGIGELGIVGAGAAIANAIYNACGVRVRDYPITPDKLIAGLPND